MTKTEIAIKIDELIVGQKASRNKKILIDLLIEGLSYSEAAEKYELSEKQIYNIKRKWLELVSG